MALIGALLDAGREEICNVEMVLKQKKLYGTKKIRSEKNGGKSMGASGRKQSSVRERPDREMGVVATVLGLGGGRGQRVGANLWPRGGKRKRGAIPLWEISRG